MDFTLPPLTLSGARVLRSGTLQAGSLGLAGGYLCDPAGPVVDLTDFAVVPGAVDIVGASFAPGDDVREVAERAVQAGTTSLWIGVDWPDFAEGLPEANAVFSLLEENTNSPPFRPFAG